MADKLLIEFRAKVQIVYNIDMTIAYQYVRVPTLTRNHCEMRGFRQSRKYGGFANSDLFPALLARIKSEKLGDIVRLDKIPAGVTIDQSEFLALVSLEITE